MIYKSPVVADPLDFLFDCFNLLLYSLQYALDALIVCVGVLDYIYAVVSYEMIFAFT